MSFNINTKLNNLSLQVQQIVASSVTNPLTSNLNCASRDITNCDTLSSAMGSPLILNAGSSQVNIQSDTIVNGDLTANNINASNVVNSITLGSGLVNAGTAQNPILSNTGVLSVSLGSGLSNTGTAQDPVLNNTGVLTYTTGTGLTNVGTSQNPIIDNAGVLSVSAGSSGISISGTSQNPIIDNTGVISVSAGSSGISLSGTSQNPVINNTGVISTTAGTGISLTGTSQNPIINNSGVTQLTAGSGISLTGSTGAITVSTTGVANVPVYMSITGSLVNFPIPNINTGYFDLNLSTALASLFEGSGPYTGINTGLVTIDMSGFGLSMTTGQAGTIDIYLNVIGTPGSGIQVGVINPSFPVASTVDASFNMGTIQIDMSAFRTAFGTGSQNSSVRIVFVNNNVNTLYPAGYTTIYPGWFFPSGYP